MVDLLPLDPKVVHAVQAAAGVLFLALMVRLRLILTASPLGAITPEILYLRRARFRGVLGAVLGIALLESFEWLMPAAIDLGWGRADLWSRLGLLVNLLQAALLVLAGWWLVAAFAPFSRLALEELEVKARRTVDRMADRLDRQHAEREASAERRSP